MNLDDWLAAYGRAWEQRDPEGAAALFSGDALYAETPFGEPVRGQDGVAAYWRDATRNQEDIEFGCDVISEGDPAVVRWRCSYRRMPDAVPRRLDGIFLLRFGPDGRCFELREWWHAVEGA